MFSHIIKESPNFLCNYTHPHIVRITEQICDTFPKCINHQILFTNCSQFYGICFPLLKCWLKFKAASENENSGIALIFYIFFTFLMFV